MNDKELHELNTVYGDLVIGTVTRDGVPVTVKLYALIDEIRRLKAERDELLEIVQTKASGVV